MKLNFFNFQCQEPPIANSEFGICDDENGEKAYIDKTNSRKWIATVKNNKKIVLTFTAIDKCIFHDNDPNYEGKGRCDGMLTSKNHLYLIELKNQKANWINHAKEQLISTIQILRESHKTELDKFKHKKAFGCNKKRSRFIVITQEEQRKFFKKFGFRLDLQTNIVVL